MTRDEIEAKLHQLGWSIVDGPTRTPGGYKATIQRETTSKMTTGSTALGVLADLLRGVEPRGRRP